MEDTRTSTRPAAEASYTVAGMTCGHCVSSVTDEVGSIDGVRDVVVDLASGALTFGSDQPIPRAAVDAAVREAGYRLA
nr:cation transporter [Nocardioides sp. LMS-CY]